MFTQRRKKTPRIKFLIILTIVISLIFTVRAFDYQIISAEQFATDGSNIYAKKVKIKAARGEILDRYGRSLAINREGYNVIFNGAYMKKNELNTIILDLTKLFSAYEEEWTDVLPMSKEFPFELIVEDGYTNQVSTLKKKLGLNAYATSQNCYDEMVLRYSLEGMSPQEQRTVMGVRYSMERNDYSVSNPFTFAEDITSKLMLVISESYSKYLGVEIAIGNFRSYIDGAVAPHIMGTTGKIYQEEWESYKKKGYSYDDYVGKSGVEKAFEEYLKGEDGEITYYYNSNGQVIDSKVTKQPKQGRSVLLTIDKNLQLVTQEALKNNILKLNSTGTNITGASVVVTEVKTGNILTSANYPSYSLDDYYNNYTELANDTSKPMFDRAFNGTYPPGSAFKPAVAIAGLSSGVINEDSIIRCTRFYTYYDKTNPPKCMHFHGNIGVVDAIAHSCNYFFFDVGRQVGITKLNSICRSLGLGESTGVEVGERKGILAGREYTTSINQRWYDGMTLSAAIGQGDNSLTPLQLSMYTATIANGGTRYKATLLNSVVNYSTGEVEYANQPTILNTLDVDDNIMNIVKEGMRAVAEEGTAQKYFKDYPIAVGGKTGTAQTTGKDNSVMIAFAPYEDPEIAITVVVEHGETGASTGPVTKAVFDAYFFGANNQSISNETYTNTILN